jgi:hypothetical protein
MIDPEYSDDGSYEAEQRWQALVSELAPDREALREVGWNCRVGYPLSVLEKRVGSLGRAHAYVKQWLAARERRGGDAATHGHRADFRQPAEGRPRLSGSVHRLLPRQGGGDPAVPGDCRVELSTPGRGGL